MSDSTDSLHEALLPQADSEAEILFASSPPLPVTQILNPESPSSTFTAATTTATTPARPFRLGGADLGVPGHPIRDIEEEGMLMGPSHPLFTNPPDYRNTQPPNPDLPVPPGARFDPISPVGPSFYSPGDPDFDELMPPGIGPSNPLGKSVRPPPHGKKNGSGSFSAPFGHPYGAPPGPGNPPFFM